MILHQKLTDETILIFIVFLSLHAYLDLIAREIPFLILLSVIICLPNFLVHICEAKGETFAINVNTFDSPHIC